MDQTLILDECLERMKAGETVAACLERHPEYAAELEPMLLAAARLAALPDIRLSEGQKLRMKVALRGELAAQKRSRLPFWRQLRGVTAAAIVAVLLFVGVTMTAVTASQPWDLAYGVRVLVERTPAWVQFAPDARMSAELHAAERRLADVKKSTTHIGGVSTISLEALVSSTERAARQAAMLPVADRTSVLERMARLETTLTALAAETPDPVQAERIDAAAAKINALIEGLSR